MGCCNSPRTCGNFDDDREGLSDSDLNRFGGDEIACPNCGADMYHDAALCAKCGHAITEARRGNRSAKPLLFVGIIAAIVGAVAIAMW
ncbi:MAG TPA: hypothetical protein VG797_07255 [Phycisphaerales bacterium]|nr:hypothetical protein [Phycisphaerales bacterium]